MVHGKKTIIDKIWGTYEEKCSQARSLYFYMYTHPGKKLNFMGNEIAHFREWDEKREMDRILSGLTSLIAPEAESLYDSLHILARLDCIFARAMLARDMDAICPKLNDKGYIKLLNARHPLIVLRR